MHGEILAPAEIEEQLAKRFRLLGTQGLVGMALAAIDMALWDALARVHSLPLARLLGGVERRRSAPFCSLTRTWSSDSDGGRSQTGQSLRAFPGARLGPTRAWRYCKSTLGG